MRQIKVALMDDMTIYNLARSVPDEAQKPITAGRLKGMTDINPMWRIKRLTEIFGACGMGWWYVIRDKQIIDDSTTKQRVAIVDIDLYYRWNGEVSQAIPGTGGAAFLAQERNGAYLSDECYKMALTDAISVAAKAIGVGADVYYAKDRDKYSAEPEKPEQRRELPTHCTDCGKLLLPYRDERGRMIPIGKWAAGTEAKYGRVLCDECEARARAALAPQHGPEEERQ